MPPETSEEKTLRNICEAIVKEPHAVEIRRSTDELGVLLELTVAKDDMGKILGKEGQTVKAIRTILRVVGMGNGARVNLKVLEPAAA
jgi:predicted RNA-binding protein YlqC (UPF0109 family)